MPKLEITQAYAQGVSVGAFVLTFFGAFWAYEAVSNWPQTPSFISIILGLPVVALFIFAVTRFMSASKLPPAPDGSQSVQDGKRAGIAFGIIFAVEFVLIALVAVILGRLNHPLLIPIVVALIVGIHFFPLARLFQVPVYSVTGLLCVVFSLASLLISEETFRVLILGLSIAMILWGSAAVVLFRYTDFSNRKSA